MAETVEQLKQRVDELRRNRTFTNERIDALNDAAWQLRYAEEPFALQLSNQALQLSARNEYGRGRAFALRNLGWLQVRTDQYKKAEQAFEESRQLFLNLQEDAALASAVNGLAILKQKLGNYQVALDACSTVLHLREKLNDLEGVASVLMSFGSTHFYTGDYRQSLECFYRGLQTAIDCDSFVIRANAYCNLAGVLWRVGEGSEAIRCSEQALALFEKYPNRRGESLALNNLGAAHQSRGEYKQSLQNYRRALAIAEVTCNFETQAESKIGISSVNCEMGDTEQAFAHLSDALQVARNIGSRFYESEALLQLGAAHRQVGDQRESIQLLESALEISAELGAKETICKAHLALSELYEAQSQMRKALVHHKEFHRFWDEVHGAQAASQIHKFLLQNKSPESRLGKLQLFARSGAANGGDLDSLREAESSLPTRKLKQVIEFMTHNLEQNLALSELAQMAALSQRHFQRVFKSLTGTTPHQFVVEQRINRARMLLQTTNLPLVEIALRCGFSSQSHLSTHFRLFTGKTPGQFRRPE